MGRLWGFRCGLSGLGLRASILCGRVMVVHARFFDRFMLRLRSCAFYIGLPLVWCFHQAGGFLCPLIGGWWLRFCLFFQGVFRLRVCERCFFFIPVGEEWSLFPSQCVMHLSVNLWFWVTIINL